MNQLPEEIIIKIFDELGDPAILVQLSNYFPNRYIFPCLFRNVIVQHELPRVPSLPTDYLYYALQEVYILEQSDGQCCFRFWLDEFVNVLSSDLEKMFWLDPIKPYISDIEFRLDIGNQDSLYWSNKVENFLSDAYLRSLSCDIRLYLKDKNKGLRKLTLYDPDLITNYGTTSVTNLRLYGRDIPTKDVILELSEQVFPSLKRLDVNSVWIKVLDFNCPLKELRILNVSPDYYPSIHKLRDLKVLALEVKQHPNNSHRFFDERLLVDFPIIFVNQKSESLESLTMKNIKCSSLSLDNFPNLKKFDYFELGGMISLENAPVTLEEFYVSSTSDFVGSPNFESLDLKKVSIVGTRIETFGNLFSECLNLSTAFFSDNCIKEIPDNVVHSNITWLNLSNSTLHHFGSVYFPMLKFLDLSSNAAVKIGSLKGCQSLQHLNVNKCRLKDIDFITDLFELEEFHAQENWITSVQPLAGKSKLKILSLNENRLVDITPINSCFNLRSLNVSFNEIKVVNLIGLKHLRELDLSNNLIHKFESLRLSDSVNELGMIRNGMTGLKGNISLLSVKNFDVSLNGFKKVRDINELQSLEILHLDDISNLSRFEGLRNLKVLCSSWCPIKSLKGLNCLSNLESATFSGSKLETLDGKYIRDMSNLNHLKIVNSSLRQLRNITMVQIEKLELHGNRISVLDGIERLPKLMILDVSNNRINKIGSSFGDFPKLRFLDLRLNYLKTGSGLEKIKPYTKLTVRCNDLDRISANQRQSNIKFVH